MSVEIKSFSIQPTNPDIDGRIQTEIVVTHSSTSGSEIEYDVDLYIDESLEQTTEGSVNPLGQSGSTQSVSFTTRIGSRGTYVISADVIGADGSRDSDFQRVAVGISPGSVPQDEGPTFEDTRPSVLFRNITASENTDGGPEELELKYDQPNIAVDTSARYQDHDILGDVTVRQKKGEDPVEITVDGVCTVEEANMIDGLRFEDTITLLSHRIEQVCQVGSTSTQPRDDGGEIDMDGEFTHTFSISLIGVE